MGRHTPAIENARLSQPRTRTRSASSRTGVGGTPFTIGHFKRWARRLILDTGDEWIVEPFQSAFVEDVFAGFTECWLIVPEENAKTTLLAGLGLYHAEFRPNAWVPVAASSRDQAQIMYRQMEGFVQRSELGAEFRCFEGYRRVRHNSSRSNIQIFAADERTGDGVIPTLALIDELHRHRDLRLYRTWRGKLGKRGGQIAAISTAGEPGSEFEQTREKIRQSGEQHRKGSFVRSSTSKTIVLHEWAVREGEDVTDMRVVKRANPLKAITVERLQEKFDSPTTTLQHWRRLTCNLPTRATNAAITEAEWFDAIADEEIPAGEPIWLGLDVAWKWDTTAAVPFWMPEPERRLLGPASVLVPPRDGTSLDPALVEGALIAIHERNPIHTVVMDISRAEQLSIWIADELGATVIERPQTTPMAVQEYDRFMEALRNGWLKHAGDPDMTSHALNAVARVLPMGDARFDRPVTSRSAPEQDRRVIDALSAASMVHAVAAEGVEPVEEPIAEWG